MAPKEKQHPKTETLIKIAPTKPPKASATRKTPEVVTPLGATTPATTSAAQGAQSTPDGTHPSLPAAGAVTLTPPSNDASPAPSAATSSATAPAGPAWDFSAGPPSVTFPAIAVGFVPSKLRALRTFNMSTLEYRVMPQVAEDLGDGTALTAALGTPAPELEAVGQEVATALAWRALRNEALEFAAYVKEGDTESWSKAWADLDHVKSLFAAALSINPSLKSTAPGLTALLGARSVPAARGNATRKKNAKAKAVAQNAAAQAATNGVTPASKASGS